MKLPEHVSDNTPLSASRHWNPLIDYLRSLRPKASPTVKPQWRPDGISYDAAPAAAIPTSQPKALGLISINQKDKTATFRNGKIDRGTRAPIDLVGLAVDVTGGTTAAPVYVYVEWDMDTEDAEIPEIATSEWPHLQGRIFRKPLCSFYSIGEGDEATIVLNAVHHEGDIFAAQIAM